MKLFEISKIYQDILDNEEAEPHQVVEALISVDEAFDEKADSVACMVKAFKAEAEAIKAEKMELDQRQRVAEKKAESLKEYLGNEMIATGKKKIETARNKVTFRKSKSVKIIDVEALEERFLRVVTKSDPNKVEIKKALEDGEIVNGALLVENENIQIK